MLKFAYFPMIFALLFTSNLWARPSYKVVCEKPDECPEWVAGLAHSQGVCSSFLVSPQIIGTNLHCIPEDLRKEKVSCRDRIIVTFPKTGRFPEETFDCDEMVHVSPPLSDTTLTPDFAFFRLKEKTTREPLELSQSGIADGALITIYKVDPGQIGTVRKVQCPAVQNSLFNPYYSEDKSPLVSLIPCPIIKGNSGSALVGADGKAHGIIFSIYDVKIPTDPALGGAHMTGAASNGANFSCLNTFFLNYVQGEPQACLIPIDEVSQKKFHAQLIEQRTKKFEKEINEKIRAALILKNQSTESGIGWGLTQTQPSIEESKKGLVMKVAIEAKCRLQIKKSPVSVGSPAGDRGATITVPSVETEQIKAFFEVDPAMRPFYRIESEKGLMSLEQIKLPVCE